MAFGTVAEGFEKYGGWGGPAHCQLMPGHVFWSIFIDSIRFSLISVGFEGLGEWGDAWTLPIDARTCIFIDFHWFSLISE